MSERLEIDRRQQLVATLALIAVDLPAEMGDAGRQIAAAARLTPGVTMSELPNLGPGSRRACLAAARELLDELLDEIDHDPAAEPIWRRTSDGALFGGRDGTVRIG